MAPSFNRSSVFRFRSGLAVFCAGLSGCSSYDPSEEIAPSAAEQRRPILSSLAEPNNDHLVYAADFRGGQWVSSAVLDPLPVNLSNWFPAGMRAELLVVPDEPRARLDSLLEEQVMNAGLGLLPDRILEVVVTFKETIDLPRFPGLRDQSRDSIENRDVLYRNGELVKLIDEARAPEHDAHAAELEAHFGARVKERFWLTNGMVIEIPLSQLRALEQHPDVQYVEPAEKPFPPPAGTMLDVRTAENSDTLFGIGGGYVALLDTGIRRTHVALKHCTASGEKWCWSLALDCVNGQNNSCTSGSNLNPEDRCEHGTGSAGQIISRMAEPNRGMVQVVVDSMKVYTSICGLSTAAAQRGFAAAAHWGDNVVVAEMQDRSGGSSGAISQAADNAFAANRMVIAAAGNYGPNAGTVTAPGNAAKVLAVGAVDTLSRELYPQSGRGPYDGRTKPDLVGLTNVMAPSSTSNTAMFEFGGTSAATPNVAALATQVWNVLNRPSPGIVYAAMLAIGNNVGGPGDNTFGAGLPRWPGNGRMIASSVPVAGSTVEVTINLPSAAKTVNVATWWPEAPTGHKHISLFVVNPQGIVVASSESSTSVFQKAWVSGSIPTGNWKLRLVPVNPSNTRTVYYAWSPN
jgi:hypothetical protein